MLIFKEIQLLPEIFLGIFIIYFIVHGTLSSIDGAILIGSVTLVLIRFTGSSKKQITFKQLSRTYSSVLVT